MDEIIHQYTRKEALADGVLIDVSKTAKRAGIKFPTAMTNTVWERYVRVTEEASCQDEDGRLWDILFMLRTSIRKAPAGTRRLLFQLCVFSEARDRAELATLEAEAGPGDDLEPVITIMLPNED